MEPTKANRTRHVTDRIDRRVQCSRTSGHGGITIRQMSDMDTDAGMRLKACAGWNQTRSDWAFFLSSECSTCFAAVSNGGVVGTVAALNYGGWMGWIAMVLVDPGFRRLGIASRLMKHAIDHLSDCECIALDATPAGREVYQRLGFAETYSITRFACPSLPPMEILGCQALPLDTGALNALLDLDRSVLGAPRAEVLRYLVGAEPGLALGICQGGTMQGFCLGRSGANFSQVGPIVARDECTARALLSGALQACAGRPVVVDVPDNKASLRHTIEALGFAPQRPFHRMVRGSVASTEAAGMSYATAGPDLG